MTYAALAWKNLVRRPVRTALTAGGVALAVAVAAINVGAAVVMRALERRREIAVLKSL